MRQFVVPPDDRTLLALKQKADGKGLEFVIHRIQAGSSFPGSPMASVLFPALIALIFGERPHPT